MSEFPETTMQQGVRRNQDYMVRIYVVMVLVFLAVVGGVGILAFKGSAQRVTDDEPKIAFVKECIQYQTAERCRQIYLYDRHDLMRSHEWLGK
jgi:hypothetical protein